MRSKRRRIWEAARSVRFVGAESLEPRRLLCGLVDDDALAANHAPRAVTTGEQLVPPARNNPTNKSVFRGHVVVTLAGGVEEKAAAGKHGASVQKTYSGGKSLWTFRKEKDAAKVLAKLRADKNVVDAYPVYSELPAADSEPIVMADMSESEPNDTPLTATVVPVSATPNIVSATMGSGDVDYFKFTLSARAGVFLDIDAFDIGLSGLDTELTLYASDGVTQLDYNDAGRDFDTIRLNDTSATVFDWNDSAIYRDLNAGTYVVKVNGWSGSTGAYQLKITADGSYTSSVPVLNSNLGAADTLHLDFDGHFGSGDAWNSGNPYNMLPYDLNGNSAEWSPAERKVIETVWSIVADLYAPFNVNVTTSYGGSYNLGVAQKQVIANSNGSEVGATGALGVAFLDVYGTAGPETHTSFTFANNFFDFFETGMSGRIVADAIEMGNTSAHELGHTLGLRHYGGSNPQDNAVMHTPDFGLSRERWVSGNTHSGESPVIFQNDISVISKPGNTFGLRADDHGNSTGAATVLSGTTSYSASAILHATSDVDFFRFAGNAATTITLDIPEHLNHLDGELYLYNSVGTLLTSADTADKLGTSVSFTLPSPGNYFVEVRSDGGPGEIGKYALAISTGTSGGFPTVYNGGSSDDSYTVRLKAGDPTKIEILESLGGGPVTTYSTDKALVPSLTFNTNGGDDLLTVDYTNGDPTAVTAINYSGGTHLGATFDRVSVIGSSGGDTINLQNSGVLTGAGIIAVTGVERATVNGNNGNDSLTTGVAMFAQTTFNGGANTDTFTYNAAEGNDTVTLATGSVTDGSTPHSYSAVESLIVNARFGFDTVNLNSSNIPVTLNGGDGNDIFNIGAGDLDTITATVTVNGDVNTDTINVNDGSSPFSDTYTLTNTTLTRAVFGGLTYATSEALIVNGQPGANFFNVNSTTVFTPVTLNGGNGNDTFNIGNGDLDPLTGPVTVNGGGNTDTINVNDHATAFGDSYTISSTNVIRDFWGGLTYGTAESLTLNAQTTANVITINSTAAATPVIVNGNGGSDTLNVNGAPSSAVTFNGGLNAAEIDTLHVNAGVFTFNSDANVGTARLALNVNTGGSALFNTTQHLEQLNIAGTGVATLAVNGSRFISTKTISITGSGELDLKDNDLIVHNGALGSWNGSAYTGVTGLVDSGRGNGSWNGSGIVTSMSDATTSLLTTLAVASAGDLEISDYAGESVAAGAVIVKYTWGGDAELDGDLDGDDYFWIDSFVAQSGIVFGFHFGDFDIDGDIDGDDYFIIDGNIAFAQTQPPL